MWSAIDTAANLPDTCDCTVTEDNAAAINWNFSLAPYGSATYSVRTNFTATGTSSTAPSSGTGNGGGSGNSKESSRHKVRITLTESARHHRARSVMSLPAGTVGERVRAILHGTGVRRATGTISYSLYRGSRCTVSRRVARGARQAIRHGRVPRSARVRVKLAPGRYSWRAVYSGNRTLQRTKSACGAAKLRITG